MTRDDPIDHSDVEVTLARYLDVIAGDGQEAADAWLADSPLRALVLDRVADLRRRGVAAALPAPPRLPTPPIQPPAVLGPYELVELLGRGGMGTVHRARHRRDGSIAAVKCLLTPRLQEATAIANFRREAMALLQLRHPGIVAIHAIGNDDAPWYAMEYVAGPTFERLLRARATLPRAAAPELLRRLGLDDAAIARHGDADWSTLCLRLVRDAAAALGHAHRHGIVHRDVKPGNLMLRTDGSVVVVDFGLVSERELLRAAATEYAGSPLYAAPEQLALAEGPPHATADVFALGIVLAELATGVHPFAGPNPASALRLAARGELSWWRRHARDLPPAVLAICLQALDPNPRRRYRDGGEFAADLDRALRGEPVLGGPPPRLVRTARWLRHRPLRVGAALLALMLAVGPPRPVRAGAGLDAVTARAVAEAEHLRARARQLVADGDLLAAEDRYRSALELLLPRVDSAPDAYVEALLPLQGLVAGRSRGARDELLRLQRERLEVATATAQRAAIDPVARPTATALGNCLRARADVVALLGDHEAARQDIAAAVAVLAAALPADDPTLIRARQQQRRLETR